MRELSGPDTYCFHRFILWAFLLVTMPGTAQDGTASSELIQALKGTTQLEGRFEQRQYGSDNELSASESRGVFRMLRPGYFSWQIESPDNQLIIASPDFIWHYDQDLETATRRTVGDSGLLSPLQILGGREELLRTQFMVSKSAEGTYSLTPNPISSHAAPAFSSLTLTLENGLIVAMDMIDALNQRVLISFHDVNKSPGLSVEDFAFTPPEGVDLFYYDE